jgi:hypothetical protein
MTQFASVLANQLNNNVDCLLCFYSPLSQELSSLNDKPNNINASQGSTSTLTITADHLQLSQRQPTDANGTEHHQIAYEIGIGSTGKRRTKTKPCAFCLKTSTNED